MNRSILALTLILVANTALAQENPLGVRGRAEPPAAKPAVVLDNKKADPPKVETPPAVALPTPVTATEPVLTCTLPPLTLPIQFAALIRDELVIISRNNAAITAYGETYKVWTQKKADYDICRLQDNNCKDPGKMPAQPKLITTFRAYLIQSGKEQAYQSFYGNAGFWLTCAELNRMAALNACEKGNPAPLTTLEHDLKKACPLVIDRRRR